MNPETQKLQSWLSSLASTSRIYLDSHRKALRTATDKSTLERRKDLARDFVRLCRNGSVVNLLHLLETPHGGHVNTCPVRFAADLQELALECHPNSQLLPLVPSCDGDQAARFSAIMDKLDALAVGVRLLHYGTRNNTPKPHKPRAAGFKLDMGRTRR